MKLVRNLVLSVFVAASLGAHQAMAMTSWDESINGDLSNDFGAPTSIGSLGVGQFDVLGNLASNDKDVFNWTLSGSKLESVTLIQWDTSTASSFYFDGTNALLPPAQNNDVSTGRFILNPTVIGSDLFNIRGISKEGSAFSAATFTGLGQIDYGFRITTSALSVVPLPAGLPLMGAGLALMGFVGWRHKRKAPAAA